MPVRLLIATLAAWLPTFGPLVCGFACPGACGVGPAPAAAACCVPAVEAVSCCGPAAECGEPAAPEPEPCCEACPCDDPVPIPVPAAIPGGLDLPIAILNRPWPSVADEFGGRARLIRRAAPAWSPGSGNSLQSVLCVWLN